MEIVGAQKGSVVLNFPLMLAEFYLSISGLFISVFYLVNIFNQAAFWLIK